MPDFPSLNGLRSFEATARLGSMTRAASELGVTQSAVSRALSLLQAELGFPLFLRTKPSIQLTSSGEAIFVELRHSFDRMRTLLARLRQDQNAYGLTINVLPTFALRFLIPRLPAFKAQHPDMQVDIVVGEQAIDFALDAVDVGIRYGNGDWPGVKTYRILDEELVIVCAPRLLEGRAAIDPGALRPEQLIRHTTRIEAWPEWFENLHLPTPTPAGLGFEHFFMVIEAAVVGIGFALLPRFLIRRELENGALVIASPHILRREQGYFFMCSPLRRSEPKILAFRRWLQGELAALTAEGRPLEM
ncbi:LysR substrate-binding domain-containing protein [Bosea sp. BIWAKO-01]|uniref:LysR substrate-binding domain-containing protein n=1 Tax=Bosea sp. BIWAKO-01 TaxID=506668 RepID=UPI00085383CF|nr:LysR substrate-binding domain-containing protein [Bosea sp. BIWAKO-01]GAU86081.1 transcriptional regulator of LysR family [Bosea sp. BIWAKO-01]